MTDLECPPAVMTATELFTFENSTLTDLKVGAGKDATAYDIGGNLIYRKGHVIRFSDHPDYKEHYQEHLARELAVYADLPDDVFVARTLINWLGDSRIHKVVEKAEGAPLFPSPQSGEVIYLKELRASWEEAIAYAAQIPDAHYQKLIDDEHELRQRDILMDYTGLGNLFYDPDKGFTIIDAEFESPIPLRGKCMYITLIGSDIVQTLIGRDTTWVGHISSQARDNIIEVLGKLEHLGYMPAYRLAFRSLCERLDYVPSYATPGSLIDKEL